MLYLSKRVADHLTDDLKDKLQRLSKEKQTLFECYYYRFSPESRTKQILLKALYESVVETDLVK